jgi:hypothetical protein
MLGCETGTKAWKREHRTVIVPPDRTAITQKNPQAFPIVHSFEGQAESATLLGFC